MCRRRRTQDGSIDSLADRKKKEKNRMRSVPLAQLRATIPSILLFLLLLLRYQSALIELILTAGDIQCRWK